MPSSQRWSAAKALVGPVEVALVACAGTCAPTRSAVTICPARTVVHLCGRHLIWLEIHLSSVPLVLLLELQIEIHS